MLRTTVLHGLIFSLLSILVVASTGCITIDLWNVGGPETQLVETVVRGEKGPKILLVEIDGVIGVSNDAGFLFGGNAYSGRQHRVATTSRWQPTRFRHTRPPSRVRSG